METKESKRLEWILLALVSFMIIFIIGFIVTIYRSNRPLAQAREEATTMAKKYTDLKSVDEFYWFNRQSTSFTLLGKDQQGKEIAVILPQDGKKIQVVNQKDGLTENEALQKTVAAYPNEKITKASLGLYEEKPVWEVTTTSENGKLNYVLWSFTTGKKVDEIQNF